MGITIEKIGVCCSIRLSVDSVQKPNNIVNEKSTYGVFGSGGATREIGRSVARKDGVQHSNEAIFNSPSRIQKLPDDALVLGIERIPLQALEFMGLLQL